MSESKISFKQHSHTVLRAGVIAIVVNLLLAIFKVVVGVLSNSIAIMSDALHGLVDTLSGIIVIISEKLGTSQKFGHSHAKIERTSARIIAIIIMVVGLHIMFESIEKLQSHEEVEYSIPTIVVLIASIAGKLLLGRYLRRTGRKVASDTLIASSVETINDSIISGAVLLSAFIYIIWGINIEAYISIIIALIILKSGVSLIAPSQHGHHH